MLYSHELYEVIETELVQDNLDPNAPEVMDVCAVSSHFKYFHQKLKINIVAAWFDILMFFQLHINVHKCKACFITRTEISKWKEVLVYLSLNNFFLILLI
jgi:hypothetical protein